MKTGTRRRYKLLILVVGVLWLFLGLVCVVKQQIPRQSRWFQELFAQSGRELEHGELDQLNKSHELKYYKPLVKFNEHFFEYHLNKITRSQHDKDSTYRNSSHQYLIQPKANVIECEPATSWIDNKSRQPSRYQTTLFVVVNSRADNFERRQRLRNSWFNEPNLKLELCSPNIPSTSIGREQQQQQQQQQQPALGAQINRIEWVFALGHLNSIVDKTLSSHDQKINLKLQEEASRYGDLLMFNLRESYRNMTRKHLAIFEWLLGQRKQSLSTKHLLLKCDDDVQLDLSQIIARYTLETNPSEDKISTSNLLMCARFRNHEPVLRKTQHRTSKWSLSRQEWPYDTFPSYCSGLVYLASLDLVEKLHFIAPFVDQHLGTALWIDDVYVTGVLLSALELRDLKLVKLNSHFCYTKSQRLHRESLEPGLKCMAAEVSD